MIWLEKMPDAVLVRAVNRKIGLDANSPIDPRTGAIEPQVADPGVIADTGASWVRLNFILGPWSAPTDTHLYDGRTWLQTYRRMVAGLKSERLAVYGLIGVEAMAEGPADRLRPAPSAGAAGDAWIRRYAERFAEIVALFQHDIQVFESFNEPDDWHGQKRNWVHPGWFAIMLQQIYSAVRSRPGLEHVKIISGPLQGLETNRNAAVGYLYETYRAGKERFGWGRAGSPFPFDGVGYHLYVKPAYEASRTLRARAILTTCRRYLNAMHEVIRQEEGQDKPLYVSEVGWSSTVDYREVQRRELFQADCLQTGLQTVSSDPLVELSCWFCTRDIPSAAHDSYYGLYRLGDPTPQNRKPAFQAFQAVCRGETVPEPVELPISNQAVISAFYQAAVELGLANRWSLLAKAGLSLGALAASRSAPYTGTPIDQLPNLSQVEKAAVLRYLGAQAQAAGPGSLPDAALHGSTAGYGRGTRPAASEIRPGLAAQEIAAAPREELDLAAALLDHSAQALGQSRSALHGLVGGAAFRGPAHTRRMALAALVGLFALVIALSDAARRLAARLAR